MNSIIKKSIDKALSYQDYRVLVKQLAEKNTNSGLEKAEDLANYTKLNDRRMMRWDKTIKISEDAQQKILKFNQKIIWLIITESWCGDAAHVIPALNKMAELNSNIEIKIVLRDDNLKLMDFFLTNGGRAIAKVIMVDTETGDVLNTYGPRPTEATELVNDYKHKNGKITPDFKEDLQHWYNKDKGQNVIHDVIGILCKLQKTTCQ
mgnify:CR=1 FL=1